MSDGKPPARPRWVVVTAAIGVALAIAAIVLVLAGGDHGPGRHLGGDDRDHRPPPGAHP